MFEYIQTANILVYDTQHATLLWVQHSDRTMKSLVTDTTCLPVTLVHWLQTSRVYLSRVFIGCRHHVFTCLACSLVADITCLPVTLVHWLQTSRVYLSCLFIGCRHHVFTCHACSLVADITCLPDCLNGGTCTNGVCICQAGFMGTACQSGRRL